MTDLNQAVPDGVALDGESYGTGFTRTLGLVSNTTEFLRPVRDGRLEVEAQPVHEAGTQQMWERRTTRADDGRLVSRGQVRLQHVARRPT